MSTFVICSHTFAIGARTLAEETIDRNHADRLVLALTRTVSHDFPRPGRASSGRVSPQHPSRATGPRRNPTVQTGTTWRLVLGKKKGARASAVRVQ